jgi:2-dehydropantoate 2-reductase
MLEAIQSLRQPDDSHCVLIDWIVLGFKSNILDLENPEKGLYLLIQPFLSRQTRILAIMNGWVDTALVSCIEHEGNNKTSPLQTIPRHPFLHSLHKCSAVYAGIAYICCNRITPGHVHHTFAGKLITSLSAIHTTTLWVEEIQCHIHAIQSLFYYTTPYFEMHYMENLIQARWKKNLWNIPFNGISVIMGGITTDGIVQDVGLRQLALYIMRETMAIANQDLASRGFTQDVFLDESEVWRISVFFFS